MKCLKSVRILYCIIKRIFGRFFTQKAEKDKKRRGKEEEEEESDESVSDTEFDDFLGKCSCLSVFDNTVQTS